MNYRNTSSYSRNLAVNYAIKYALTPNPNYKYFSIYQTIGGDCTNFTSQCLHAGGAPMVFSGKNTWWYNAKTNRWSVSWTVAGSLYWYLKINAEKNLYGIKGTEVPSLSSLEIGDLIFYRNNKGAIAHSAIITSFYNGRPFISQHTFNALNITYVKDWASKMHFIKIWLSSDS